MQSNHDLHGEGGLTTSVAVLTTFVEHRVAIIEIAFLRKVEHERFIERSLDCD